DSDESKLLTYPVTDQAYTQIMSEDLSFAAAVAEFGMLLRGSAYKGSTTQDSILSLVSNCNIENDDYKQEFVQLVKAANLQ
ncbi:MAG TPA: VWA domain-containing protein, partial [Ruminococcaceae bacterium]|nr:VWA domain-containing protein [Oscillospiraceae bacterium]